MLVSLPAVLEAVAVPVHFEDVDMVGEAIEECSGQPFRAKYLGPLVEGQVGCHQDRSAPAPSTFVVQARVESRKYTSRLQCS